MKKIFSEDAFSLNAWNGLSNRILEAAPDGLVLVDREGRILAVNRQTLRMFGYEREELVGREIEMLIPERFRDGHVRLRDEFMGTTGTRPMGAGKTLFGCRRDGSEFPVDIGLSPIGAGPGIRVAAFIRDISLQNKVEEDLRRSREGLEKRVQERTSELVKANYALESEINKKKKVEVRLREEGERAQKYLDLAGVIFVAIDTRQNVILLNRKGCEVLGVAENEAVGKNWFDHFIPEPERERTREAFKNLISGRIEPVEYFENRVLGRDGEKKMIAWHNTVLRGENGEIQATLSSGLDVSEKEELERRVRHAEKLAAVGKMASGFAHEIGTPLSVIGGRAEYMLRKMSKDDPLRENLGRIIGQMERIAKIVKKFLSFTRSQPIEISTVGIKPLLDDILPLFEHQILRQGIKTEMDIPASTPEIEADRDQLQQVFFNIIHNAVQVMPGGGTLSVRSREATPPQGPSAPLRRFVKIDVGDTGPGVSSENISRIFDPFFTTKEIGEGTGLGLSVGYNIVKNHGGWIQVDSDAGKGAVFSVFLPVERQG